MQGTFVVAVTARDGDLVLNAPVQYLIDQGETDNLIVMIKYLTQAKDSTLNSGSV